MEESTQFYPKKSRNLSGFSLSIKRKWALNEETPPCLPLSGEVLRNTATSCSSPDKGRLGGVFLAAVIHEIRHYLEEGL